MTIVRAAPRTSIAVTLLLALALGAGCFSLPKVNPGNRILDDFDEDAGINTPTWSAFTGWTCGPFVSHSQEEQDGGPGGEFDGGRLANPDAGQSVSCGAGPHGEGTAPNNQALVATFDVVAPIGSDPFGVVVATTTNPGTVVDLTGFTQLLFDAELYSTTVGQAMLPSGTKLEVELGCSPNRTEMAMDRIGEHHDRSPPLAPHSPPGAAVVCLDAGVANPDLPRHRLQRQLQGAARPCPSGDPNRGDPPARQHRVQIAGAAATRTGFADRT